jgi:chemotaxis signal transduction protein
LGLNFTEKKDTDMVLLVESSKLLMSFVVEKVLDFVEVENSKVQALSTNIPARLAYFVRGLYDADNMGKIYLLETERLLNSNRLFVQENE